MPETTAIQDELERCVLQRTGRRVRELSIELFDEHVVLHGHVDTFYVKQLAQSGVRDLLPQVQLDNAIIVDHAN